MAYKNPVPYSVLEKAVAGDILAMQDVVSHYQGYIKSLSRQKYIDDLGVMHVVFDDTIRTELEARLMEKILAFDLDR